MRKDAGGGETEVKTGLVERTRYKRLEAGTFRFPKAAPDVRGVELRPSELAMLLDGIDLRSVRRLKRFAPAAR